MVYKNGTQLAICAKKGGVFSDIPAHKEKLESLTAEQLKPFNPVFLRKYPLSEQANNIVREFISDTKNAGSALCALLELDSLTDNDRKAALALLPLCYDSGNKNGLISVLRTEHMKNYISNARKMMFFADFIENGPQF